MKKKRKTATALNKVMPRYAAGDEELLDKPATAEERARGDFTRVTKLILDEMEPSREK